MEQLAAALSRHTNMLHVGEPELSTNNVLQGFAARPARIQ